MPRFQRRKKLIKPGLQMRVVLSFLTAAVIGTVVQAVVLNWTLLRLARSLPHDESILLDQWPGLLRQALLLSLALTIPLLLALGIHVTFRIAGPLHRIEDHLRRLRAGEDPGPCRIRKGDELGELCTLVDEVTEPLRTALGASGDPEPVKGPHLEAVPRVERAG